MLRQRLQDLQTFRRLHHHRLAQEGAWVRDIKASAHEYLVGLDPYVHGKVLQINKLDQQKDLQESLHTNVNAVDQKVTASFSHSTLFFSSSRASEHRYPELCMVRTSVPLSLLHTVHGPDRGAIKR